MLTHEDVQRILETKAKNPKLSARKLAKVIPYSRTTIARVLSDEFVVKEKRTRAIRNASPYAQVPAYKCPDCGHTVTYRPCMICATRKKT